MAGFPLTGGYRATNALRNIDTKLVGHFRRIERLSSRRKGRLTPGSGQFESSSLLPDQQQASGK